MVFVFVVLSLIFGLNFVDLKLYKYVKIIILQIYYFFTFIFFLTFQFVHKK